MVRRVATARPSAERPLPETGPWSRLPAAWRGRAGASELRFQLLHDERRPQAWELRLLGPEAAVRWALPDGIPWAEGEIRRLDAPSAQLEGPHLWDEGRCDLALHRDMLELHLSGSHVRGRHVVQPRGPGSWLLRRTDPPSVRPMPTRVLPMLAHAAAYPEDEANWAFEIKWDGARTLAFLDGGATRLRSRTLADVTAQYPEISPLARAVDRQAVLDGEIVAFDEHGLPSFQRLQGRFGVTSPSAAGRLAEETPVTFLAFDVLYLDGHDTTALPYEARRELLESLRLDGPAWRVPPALVGHGRELLGVRGLEGIVAKRLGSPYEPGARSRSWRKIKQQRRQELVIGGWTPGRGARRGRIGALLVGHFDPPANGEPAIFHYAGSVGTGFRDADLRRLGELLAPLRRETSPFAEDVDKPDAVYVEPVLVAEFEFTEWTQGGRLRHPSFKGLRTDKDPREVVREEE